MLWCESKWMYLLTTFDVMKYFTSGIVAIFFCDFLRKDEDNNSWALSCISYILYLWFPFFSLSRTSKKRLYYDLPHFIEDVCMNVFGECVATCLSRIILSIAPSFCPMKLNVGNRQILQILDLLVQWTLTWKKVCAGMWDRCLICV
jgi:hypothetical protein